MKKNFPIKNQKQKFYYYLNFAIVLLFINRNENFWKSIYGANDSQLQIKIR